MRKGVHLPGWAHAVDRMLLGVERAVVAPLEWLRRAMRRRLLCPYVPGPRVVRDGTSSHFCLACGEPAGYHE